MNKSVKLFVSYILIGTVLTVTIVAVLAIWGLIEINANEMFNNVMLSLIAIILGALVVLAINNIFLKENTNKNKDEGEKV
jgi:membrane protein DedA with SNARE-associated domain